MFQLTTILLLAWGALAFGAEYSWAYAPLLVMCLLPGIFGLRARNGSGPSAGLLIALAAVFVAALVQAFAPASLIPSSPGAASPEIDFLNLYARVTMQPPTAAGHSDVISIAPARTQLGLAFLAAFTLLLAGCARGISALGTKKLVRGIVVLGVVVAFVGLIQAAVRTETIYGFWRQPRAGVPFAPFMNENHFAGWMAMVMSLAVGAFAGDVSGALRNVAPGWRNRILWFSSQRASEMILTAFAVAVMALSMVITFSRGGLVGLLAVCLIGAWWMMRRQSGLRRATGGVCLIVILIAAAIWGGADKTIDQFSGASTTFGGRKEIWNDTLRIIQTYPVTGTGLNTFGIAMLHYQSAPINTGAVVEAHNDYLQLAAEGGLLLGIPILLALLLFIREVWRRFREGADDAEAYWVRAGAVTGLCAIAVMEIFDFTLQMPGAAAMFTVLAAVAIHRPAYLQQTKGSARAESRRG